ncbi:hypothetical protein HMPREF1396_01363 [Helicobacter pylori GAM114Ai]|nr:hypothetical protein HMPREF1396_01363 [Helicobacter pylori GAM114Ai]
MEVIPLFDYLIGILGCFSNYKNFEALKLFKSFQSSVLKSQ